MAAGCARHRGLMQLMEFDPDRSFILGFGDGPSHDLRTDAQRNIWAIGLQQTSF
jgi:hypothetical protein